MKTPIQELIEIIKKRQEDDEAMPFMYNDRIIKLAESMLEKEWEEIIDAHMDGQCDDTDGTPFEKADQYYNDTFNTKEK
jgi:hypothetical protein